MVLNELFAFDEKDDRAVHEAVLMMMVKAQLEEKL